MIIRLSLIRSQNERSMQAPTPAEPGSFGASAWRLRLAGADARVPPRPTLAGREAGADSVSNTTMPLICRAVEPHNALKFHIFLEN